MKLSRRGFLGKSLKALAVVAIAPVAIPKVIAEITANPVPPIVKPIPEPTSFPCKDFQPNITIADYKPGETIPYQDLLAIEPSCMECQYAHACTATGKRFVKHEPAQHKAFEPEIWSKELQARFYKDAFLTKLL